jgi:hypothetical protein
MEVHASARGPKRFDLAGALTLPLAMQSAPPPRRVPVNAARYVGRSCTPMLEIPCYWGPGSTIRPGRSTDFALAMQRAPPPRRVPVNASRYAGRRCTPMLEMTCFGGPGSATRPQRSTDFALALQRAPPPKRDAFTVSRSVKHAGECTRLHPHAIGPRAARWRAWLPLCAPSPYSSCMPPICSHRACWLLQCNQRSCHLVLLCSTLQ